MKKKKIVFVTPNYLPVHLYGSDTVVRLLAEKFARSGFDTSVLTSNVLTPLGWYDPFFSKKIRNPYEVIHGVNVYRLPCNQLFAAGCYILLSVFRSVLPTSVKETLEVLYAGPRLVGLRSVLLSKKFDVIHCSPFPLSLNKQVADIVGTLPKRPKLIFTPFFHAKVETYRNTALQAILRRADFIHAVTHVEKEDIRRIHAIDGRKISVIPLCIDTRLLHEGKSLLADVEKFKRQYNLHGKKVVLFAGVKGPMKGAIDLLRAAERLYKRDTRYVLVAIGHNGKEWESARRHMRTDFLVDLGYKQGREKEVIFASCDMFCMPSKSDSFGLVYLEAWHKKKPVIAADIPAMREIILGNNGGLLVQFGNIEDIQSAIGRLVDHPVLSKTLGERGFKALMEKYSMQSVFPLYHRMFMS